MGLFSSRQTGETLRAAGALSTVGLSFVLALVIGAWFGRVLDGWLGTAPWFFILFFFFGLAAGILNVYRTVSKAFPPSAPPGAAAETPSARAEEPGRRDPLEPADD
jgi:F0F1-type ATP synthase assembly protein I